MVILQAGIQMNLLQVFNESNYYLIWGDQKRSALSRWSVNTNVFFNTVPSSLNILNFTSSTIRKKRTGEKREGT